MPLKTDYKNDVLNTSLNEKRKYKQTNNADGTISLDDMTAYAQEGSLLGADDMNATNTAVNELTTLTSAISSQITSGDIKFRFAVNGEGKYGYLGADDSFNPFNRLPKEIRINYGHDHHGEPRIFRTAVFTKQKDDTYKLTSGGELGSSCTHVWETYHRETFTSKTVILGVEFVYD